MPRRNRPSFPIGIRAFERRLRDLRRHIGSQVLEMREEAGLTRAQLALAAGIDPAHQHRIEAGTTGASIDVLAAIATALGADLGVRLLAGSGPRIRDRFQAPIIESLIRALDHAWAPQLEVPVRGAARGVVDLVIRRPDDVVAVEVHSELRRLEEVLRRSAEKVAALEDAEGRAVSRLLIVRSTVATREVARRYEASLRAAVPARSADAYDALVSPGRPWPGPALLWARLENGRAELLRHPPRGVPVGRWRTSLIDVRWARMPHASWTPSHERWPEAGRCRVEGVAQPPGRDSQSCRGRGRTPAALSPLDVTLSHAAVAGALRLPSAPRT